ncbi:hypothetical protein PtA15_7A144 [Puccinia triticina]|uniref:Uncharacterized protein n=1 Tax=Puccinia triticina TaxID=208348 RepID=A0ABY7CNA3_9BASI|nr:uncharacterized protein PtA15_7A144 [Puccinia triticina]WAQ86418.1 hypothetical protein PtA15_7A144 [Puccinia triticina]
MINRLDELTVGILGPGPTADPILINQANQGPTRQADGEEFLSEHKEESEQEVEEQMTTAAGQQGQANSSKSKAKKQQPKKVAVRKSTRATSKAPTEPTVIEEEIGGERTDDPVRPTTEPDNSRKRPADIMRVLEKAWEADEAGDKAKATMFFEIVAALGKAQGNEEANPSQHPLQQNQPATTPGSQTAPRSEIREGGENRPIFLIPISKRSQLSRTATIGKPPVFQNA